MPEFGPWGSTLTPLPGCPTGQFYNSETGRCENINILPVPLLSQTVTTDYSEIGAAVEPMTITEYISTTLPRLVETGELTALEAQQAAREIQQTAQQSQQLLAQGGNILAQLPGYAAQAGQFLTQLPDYASQARRTMTEVESAAKWGKYALFGVLGLGAIFVIMSVTKG